MKKCLQTFPNVPWGTKLPLTENCWPDNGQVVFMGQGTYWWLQTTF